MNMEISSIYQKILQNNKFNISIDTRNIKVGDVYIGIKGENFDGNKFASDAINKGASLAIVNSGISEDEKYIIVDDTHKILSDLANYHRNQFNIPIIAIGGSNGKTTTKELINAVLNKKYKTHVTNGNLNNDIGVPLTLLAMPMDTEIAIIEIGANHALEHTKLMNIISPTCALVTNNGADHLEGFGSMAGARKANKEIYDWSLKNNIPVFINKNILDLLEDSKGCNKIIYPKEIYKSNSSLYAGVIYSDTIFETSLFGSYNEPNILAAISVGEYFNVEINKIKEAISEYVPTLKRSQLIKTDDYTFILDCYNANPTSMELALQDFFSQTINEKRIVLIGDMFELGDEEDKSHTDILILLSSLIKNDDEVIIIGPRFYRNRANFQYKFFEDVPIAREYFNALSLKNRFIFVKASRGTKIEEVIKEKISI